MKLEKIRDDFALLRKKEPPVYWDNACVSLKPQQVLDAMNTYYEEFPACAGRSAHVFASKVTDAISDSRRTIRKFFDAKKDHEIVFTRNTTEGLNLVAKSLQFEGAVLTTDKEHNSNYVPWLSSEHEHIVVETHNGVLDMDLYEQALASRTVGLVAVNHVSNLDGIENPVKKMVKLAHKHGAKVLVDGAQSAGHMAVSVRDLGADFFACSSHKMLGPSGMGVLYVRDEAYEQLDPFLLGGDTVDDVFPNSYELKTPPHRYEAGLQNYAGMIGTAAACKYLSKLGLRSVHKHIHSLCESFRQTLHDFPVSLVGSETGSVVSFTPENMDARELAQLLSAQNVQTRAGAFCVHSWFHKYDHKPAIRFSPYVYNTTEELEKIRGMLEDIQSLL